MKTKNDKKILYLKIIICSAFLLSIVLNIVFIYTNQIMKYKNDENILFFGDSITEEYDLSKYFPKHNTINKGVSGNKVENLIDRIDKDVYKYNPSKVFVLIGINDLCSNADQDDIIFGIQTIINGIKINRKYSDIYLQSIYPVNSKMEKNKKDGCLGRLNDNDNILSLNKKIKKLASENDIVYVNVYDKLLDKNGNLKEAYTKDGLHLNNLGYLRATSVLTKYVEE